VVKGTRRCRFQVLWGISSADLRISVFPSQVTGKLTDKSPQLTRKSRSKGIRFVGNLIRIAKLSVSGIQSRGGRAENSIANSFRGDTVLKVVLVTSWVSDQFVVRTAEAPNLTVGMGFTPAVPTSTMTVVDSPRWITTRSFDSFPVDGGGQTLAISGIPPRALGESRRYPFNSNFAGMKFLISRRNPSAIRN